MKEKNQSKIATIGIRFILILLAAIAINIVYINVSDLAGNSEADQTMTIEQLNMEIDRLKAENESLTNTNKSMQDALETMQQQYLELTDGLH